MGRLLTVGAELEKQVLREIDKSRNLKVVQAQVLKEGKKNIALPMRDEARVHYSNMLDNVVDFIEESGIDNGSSGSATFAAVTATGSAVTVQSLVPWKALNDRYAKKKQGDSFWKNKGGLAGYAQPLRSMGGVSVTGVKASGAKSVKSRSLGKLTFSLRLRKLPKVFEEILEESFVTGKAVNPASLKNQTISRNGIGRIMFLEKYRSEVGAGGPGRPMLTAIAGRLGQALRTSLSAFKGKVR